MSAKKAVVMSARRPFDAGKINVLFDALRAEDRLQTILRKMNLD